MTDLPSRIEAADESEQRELLLEAFDAIFPEGEADRLFRFVRMLNAEAYESAAMMLVPGGCPPIRLYITDKATAVFIGDIEACALTPALALAAASLRAQEGEGL